MRICFIGHSHHRITRSHDFFLKLLRRIGVVETFYDESWRGVKASWIRRFDSRKYDLIAVWQVREALRYLKKPHPNVVFIPMYDAFGGERFEWSTELDLVKFLCFSSALYRQVSKHTGNALHVQYYPDPKRYKQTSHANGLNGYFWQRVPAVNLELLSRLCRNTEFRRFSVHYAPDPFSGNPAAIELLVRARRHLLSYWTSKHSDYLAELLRHNVFFASRLSEGIGMAFLEAMAMGMCVVAPDTPTHNEYIVHSVNGLLYRPESPDPLSFHDAARIGAGARETVSAGRLQWNAATDEVLQFLASPYEAEAAVGAQLAEAVG
jgi:hypothetical protein